MRGDDAPWFSVSEINGSVQELPRKFMSWVRSNQVRVNEFWVDTNHYMRVSAYSNSGVACEVRMNITPTWKPLETTPRHYRTTFDSWVRWDEIGVLTLLGRNFETFCDEFANVNNKPNRKKR